MLCYRSCYCYYYLLPTILLLINIYNLPPSEPLFAASVLASTPCTFWRLISRIPLHSDDAMSWCATAPERGAPGRALTFPGPYRGFEGSRRSRLDAVRFLRTRARAESLLCIRVRIRTRFASKSLILWLRPADRAIVCAFDFGRIHCRWSLWNTCACRIAP